MKDETKELNEDITFSIRLKELIKDKGISQKELANALGMTRQAISLYTNGQRTPDIKVLKDICRYFNVSSDYLLGLSDVKSFDLDIKAISEKTGLSDYSVEMLISYNEQLMGGHLIPIVSYLIEQECPLYFEEEKRYLLEKEEVFVQISANEEYFEQIKAEHKKLNDDYLEWKNKHEPLLTVIEDYFAATASNEKLYITGKTIKKEADFKGALQKAITTRRTVEANKLVEQVFVSEIGDVLKVLKKRYRETKGKIYSIDFE